MKFLVVLAAFVALSSAQFQGFSRAKASFQPFARPAAAAAYRAPAAAAAYKAPAASSGDQAASIVRNEVDIKPDGTYNYAYETDNGIAAQVQGSANVASGSFAWTAPGGEPVAISFVADENGYQPSGDALPTPPPTPPQILRALEWLAKYAPPQQ